MSVIDNIIQTHTKYSPTDFTGGNIQISVSKHTKQLTISLVLYFGFNASRNPISKSFQIDKSDINKFSKDLILRAEAYIVTLNKSGVQKLSYEDSKSVLRSAINDSDTMIRDSGMATSSDIVEENVDEEFDIIYTEQNKAIKKSKTENGRPRRNSGSKIQHLVKYKTHRKTFTFETMVCIVRSDMIGKQPKDIANLLGKSFPLEFAKQLNKQDNEMMKEVIESSDKDFEKFIDALEE